MELDVSLKAENAFNKIYGDSKRYEQILMNFISNALKFSVKGGTVKVELYLKKIQNANQHFDGFDQDQRNNLQQIIESFNEGESSDD